MNIPCLTEPGIRYWMSQSLSECRKLKDNSMNVFYNIGLTIALILGVLAFLYYNYKGNITPEEIATKNRVKQEYIMSKLQKLTTLKKQKGTTMLTEQPAWDNHPELAVLNRKLYV